jgi:hypothetical protein
MISEELARTLVRHDLLDRDGDRIGEISRVFVSDRGGEPTWVTVRTGWFGHSESFVPLSRVRLTGNQIRAASDTATIKAAPHFAVDQPLSPQDEDDLRGHYARHDAGSSAMTGDAQPAPDAPSVVGGHQPIGGNRTGTRSGPRRIFVPIPGRVAPGRRSSARCAGPMSRARCSTGTTISIEA